MEEHKRIPELRPEIVFVYDLVRQLVDGRVRIPRFQRPFVWRREQMIDLLDSINRQYPIGSLLAWETDDTLVSLSAIGPIRISASPGVTSTYILDGHQRLSTIAGALVSEENRSVTDDSDPARWNIFYNAEENVFEHREMNSRDEAHLFPMSKILDTFEFLQECKRVLDSSPDRGQFYVERVQDVSRAFQNYKIPVIQIRQTDLTEAVEIFARLNSRGQAMTSDQMVSAMLYREGDTEPFDLAEEISRSVSLLEENGFGRIDRTIVLRALLAAAGEDIYRTDWTRIAQTRREALLGKFRALIPELNRSFEQATVFLRQTLNVSNDRLLPYSMQFVVISSFFLVQRNPSVQQIALIRRWFWVSSFGLWFGGANPSRVNILIKDVIENVASNREDPRFTTIDLDSPVAGIPDSFDMRGARTRALLLVLIQLGPLDRHGRAIPVEEIVADLGPHGLVYVSSEVEDKDLARGPANRIFRDDRFENAQAKHWLATVSPEIAETVWRSHAIDPASIRFLASGNVDTFLAMRAHAMTVAERRFMEAEGVTLPGDTYGNESSVALY